MRTCHTLFSPIGCLVLALAACSDDGAREDDSASASITTPTLTKPGTATEASAADVQGLTQVIADRKIKAIFVESSVPKATVEAVQAAVKSKGWDVAIGGQLFSDAMGNEGTPEGTYIGMVRHNVDTIVKALR